MGTNYYSVKRGAETLSSDDFWTLYDQGGDDVLHIGKSSGGWCFSLHVIPERGINDLWDWIAIVLDPDRIIIDEYRDTIEFNRLWSIITARSSSRQSTWSAEDYRRNCAEPGPNNLVRHVIGHGCLGHGLGTWDCIEGRFS